MGKKMGIFTEISLACMIKPGTSDVILRDLAFWCGEIESEFEQVYPWFYGTFKYVNSTRFPGVRYYSLENCEDDDAFCFSLRATRKNYDREIEEFLAWLAPYSATEGFVGHLHHEFNKLPKLIIFLNGKAFLREVSSYNDVECQPALRGYYWQ